MPIEGVSDIIRMPRLGKIHLGIKVESPGKTPYPRPTDFFVCPPDVQNVFGEKPRELEIMLPTEDPNQFSPQWLRCYSLTQGLVCIGDGVTARRKIDLTTGDKAGHATKAWEWREGLTCNPQECPEYLSKRCRRVMNLMVLIPKVPGLGVWQIDTSSFYSIVNINSMVKLLKELAGRCSFIPLRLVLGPMEVTPPGMTKKIVHTLHIKQDMTLAEIARIGQRPAPLALMPEPEVEEAPEDLFPDEVLGVPPPGKSLFDEEPPIVEEERSIEELEFDSPAELPFPREEAISQIKEFLAKKKWHQPTCEAWLLQKVGYRTLLECPNELLAKLIKAAAEGVTGV